MNDLEMSYLDDEEYERPVSHRQKVLNEIKNDAKNRELKHSGTPEVVKSDYQQGLKKTREFLERENSKPVKEYPEIENGNVLVAYASTTEMMDTWFEMSDDTINQAAVLADGGYSFNEIVKVLSLDIDGMISELSDEEIILAAEEHEREVANRKEKDEPEED